MDSCTNLTEALDFDIMFGGYWFKIKAKDYTLSDKCVVCISRESTGKWIIGNAAMRGYYSVFNVDTRKFGMTPYKSSTKPLVTAATKPANTAYPDMWEYISIGVGSALTAVSSYFIWTKVYPDP